MMPKAAVIGFGCAGFHGVKGLRAAGWTGEIHVYTDTGQPPANPMLTTYYASGRLPYEGLFPFGPLEEIAERYGLTLHCAPVTGLDSASKTVRCADGTELSFDRVLLSTGARALVPPLEGTDLDGVYCMRTVRDAERLSARLEQGPVRSAVVVGASMVGIKLVELLHRRGCHCVLADLAQRIFPLAALEEAAAEIQARLLRQGVDLRFGAGIQGISQQEDGLRASFGDGSHIDCDLVLLCMGTRADTRLADEGIRVNRGIMVNQRMETSAPGVYAAGDCCEGRNLQSGQTQIIGLWANAARQGEVAGRSMAGLPACTQGDLPHNITHFLDMDFIGVGDNRLPGTPLSFTSRDGSTRIWAVRDGKKLVCLNILDNCKSSGVLKQYLIRRLSGNRALIPAAGRARLLWEGISPEFLDLLET